MELLEQVAEPLRLVERLERADRLDPLDEYPRLVLDAARSMLADDGVDVLEVSQAIAAVNDALTGRLLALLAADLGPPPCAYAWMALGSHGRGEQVLSSDQDSALAYAHDAADPAWFGRLAEAVVDALARAGLPKCDGGYMATSWARPLDDYRRMFAEWIEAPVPEALLRAEVFLDVRPVAGELSVAALERTLVVGGSHGPFRAQLARAAVTFRPPLGLFGRLRTVDGAVDVKRAGTAAIVLLARLYALVGGGTARTTALRLAVAADAGALGRESAHSLTEAYRLLTGLRLRHQVQQAVDGRAPDNRIRVDDLAPADRDLLRDTLRLVRDVQDDTAARFATHTVS